MVRYYKSLCEVVERTSNHGDPHVGGRTLMKCNVDGVSPAVLPVLLIHSEAWLREALVEVGRDVHLYAHLLWELRALRVATRDEDTTVGKELAHCIKPGSTQRRQRRGDVP